MSHKRRMAVLLGLCTLLAACDGTSSHDLTGPELSEAESRGLSSLSDSWSARRALAPYRTTMVAGALNGIIYVVGGVHTDWTANRAYQLSRVDAYDIATNTLSQVAS